MKNKELKNIAKRLIQLENVISNNEDQKKVKEAKNEIIKISGRITPEDMFAIDEFIQDFYNKK